MRTKWKILLVFLLLTVAAILYNYPKLNIISGYAAKNMASSVFIAGRSEKSIVEHDNNMPLIKLSDVEVEENSATASVFGLMNRKAIFRKGLGSVLVKGNNHEIGTKLSPERWYCKEEIPFPYGDLEPKDTIFSTVNYSQLNKAVENAFSNPEVQKTRTVLICYKNNIIAEKYIDGFDKKTKILGWSMTKSILATLYGILNYQEKIDINSPAPIVSWQDDERKNITINNLLRMQSGLEWEENYGAISDVTKMLFLDADMTKAQEKKTSVAKPTEVWNYSSGTSNLLSGILRKQFKTHQEYLNFPYEELIDKIGMYSMLMEADLEGNYVASSYSWATTRDWAKFGLLYLNNGGWNGEQLFSPNWIKYITKPTKNSNGEYGAHFWLNAGGKYPDAPKDMYMASGFQGQLVIIIPSKDLVIVRTGLAGYPNFDLNNFVKEVINSIN